MRFVSDEMTASWLRDFIPDSENFDWDKGNLYKNMKHGISSDEIESVFCQAQYTFVGAIIEPTHDEWRGLVLGQTSHGKRVALIFTKRGEKIRPISCRIMRPNE